MQLKQVCDKYFIHMRCIFSIEMNWVCLLFQKEEMGEVLHEVDFNQLKIENQQYLEKIDEKNQDLLRLKLMDGNVQQILNTYKKKLHTLTMESSRLKLEIQQRNELLSKIDTETHMVEKVLCSLQLLMCLLVFFFFLSFKGFWFRNNWGGQLPKKKKKAIHSRSTQMMFYQCKFFFILPAKQ